jgi:DNA-directed RNA polymerase specialized sigma24 family protein
MSALQQPSRTPSCSSQRHAASQNTVNKPLTPGRARLSVPNEEYAAFTRRILRAYARRVAAGDIDAMTRLAALAEEIDAAIRQAVTGLRLHGYSWAEIGARLGVTRQAAQQHWGTHPGCGGDTP